MAIPPLKNPPIIELVIGFMFEPVEQLDLVRLAKYCLTRETEFPLTTAHPALRDNPSWAPYDQSHRLWMITEDDQIIVQLQNDRMYLNWRKRGRRYPRFGDHDGEAGLLSRALDEFDKFGNFCAREAGSRPDGNRVEVTKIDQLAYTDIDDLASKVSLAAGLRPLVRSPDAELQFNVAQRLDDIDLIVRATNAGIHQPDGLPVLQMEMRATTGLASDSMRKSFERLSSHINEVFEAVFLAEAMRQFQEGQDG